RLGRLPILEPFGNLPHGDQRQAPGTLARVATRGKQIGELRIVVEHAKHIVHLQADLPFCARRMSDTGRLKPERLTGRGTESHREYLLGSTPQLVPSQPAHLRPPPCPTIRQRYRPWT